VNRQALIGVAVGWLSLSLGLLLFYGLRRWQRRRRYGQEIEHGLLLVEYGRRMTATSDRAEIVRLFTADLPALLGVKRALLLLPEDYALVGGGLRLPISHAAVRWIASAGEAQVADRGHLGALIQQGHGDLAWTRVWVPLMRGIDLRGLWLLGERGPGTPGRRETTKRLETTPPPGTPRRTLRFSPQDLRWLAAVGRQAALVLEAIRHAEQERLAASDIRALYRQVVSAREAERGRIARELHDGVLQDLCAVARDLKALETQAAFPKAENAATLSARAGEAVQALRAVCNDLRPPLLQQDLLSALKALVEGLDARSSAPVHMEVQIQRPEALFNRLSDNVALALFRITQEALHNALQHADASEIAVSLTQYPDRLRLTIVDDGCGIPSGMSGRIPGGIAAGNKGSDKSVETGLEPGRFVAQGHFGLAGMRERAAMIGARLDVQTAVDYGTAIIVQLPCSQWASSASDPVTGQQDGAP
jgi:signal transduction histidine kinase